jgi:hypothetical protein
VKIAKQKNAVFCLAHAFGGAPGVTPGGWKCLFQSGSVVNR